MSNPFDALTEQEQWGGAFECNVPGCWQVVTVADYSAKTKTLSWECPQGHQNQVVTEIE